MKVCKFFSFSSFSFFLKTIKIVHSGQFISNVRFETEKFAFRKKKFFFIFYKKNCIKCTACEFSVLESLKFQEKKIVSGPGIEPMTFRLRIKHFNNSAIKRVRVGKAFAWQTSGPGFKPRSKIIF